MCLLKYWAGKYSFLSLITQASIMTCICLTSDFNMRCLLMLWVFHKYFVNTHVMINFWRMSIHAKRYTNITWKAVKCIEQFTVVYLECNLECEKYKNFLQVILYEQLCLWNRGFLETFYPYTLISTINYVEAIFWWF